jgi:hypothetical protein
MPVWAEADHPVAPVDAAELRRPGTRYPSARDRPCHGAGRWPWGGLEAQVPGDRGQTATLLHGFRGSLAATATRAVCIWVSSLRLVGGAPPTGAKQICVCPLQGTTALPGEREWAPAVFSTPIHSRSRARVVQRSLISVGVGKNATRPGKSLPRFRMALGAEFWRGYRPFRLEPATAALQLEHRRWTCHCRKGVVPQKMSL